MRGERGAHTSGSPGRGSGLRGESPRTSSHVPVYTPFRKRLLLLVCLNCSCACVYRENISLNTGAKTVYSSRPFHPLFYLYTRFGVTLSGYTVPYVNGTCSLCCDSCWCLGVCSEVRILGVSGEGYRRREGIPHPPKVECVRTSCILFLRSALSCWAVCIAGVSA